VSAARLHLPISAILAVLACITLAACGDGATPGGTTQITKTPDQPELITSGETKSYRERITEGLGSITWTGAYSSPTPEALDKGVGVVRAAISANAAQLAAVDYVALALPDWVTVTRKLQVTPADFTGDGARPAEVGSVDGKSRWVLYEWQGPEIPQRDDRPIVYRWVTVHALYDIAEARVTRLLATIRGEVHE
jgi:hypothetical protein